MTKTITPTEMLSLIDINQPYFAFDEILLENNFVFANVPVQQPLGHEAGPISAAESSRHLAILGVCSCALKNPVQKKHYYLAYKGIYERVETHSNTISSRPLTGKATCISVDKRKAEAVTELLDANGDTIIRLRVYYHVILDTTFERLYKEHYIANPDFKIENPYEIKHPFIREEFSATQMRADMGKIPEYYCAGHFPQYPALPVAILAYNLFDMASRLTAHILANPNTKTIVRQYEITADNLAFAGDDVKLDVFYNGSIDQKYHNIIAEGVACNSKSIGKIKMIVENCDANDMELVLATTLENTNQKYSH